MYNPIKGFIDVLAPFNFGLIGLGKLLVENIINANKLKEAQYNVCLMEFIKNCLPSFVEER
jgi:hypothetical protein